MVGALSGFIGLGLAFVVAGCLVVAFAGGLVGAPLRVASHADTAAGVARSRAAMASTSASALILRPACFTRTATVSTLVVGRPLKLTPFPVAWPLVGRGAWRAWPASPAWQLPDGCPTTSPSPGRQIWPLPRSGRPGRLPGPWPPGRPSLAGRCHRRDSAWPLLPWMPLPGHFWPAAGRTPVGSPWPYQRASWAPWQALLWVPSVVVLPCWNPHARRQAGLSYGHSCRRPWAAHNPTCVSTLHFQCSFPLHL